jgi:hypothetical protein
LTRGARRPTCAQTGDARGIACRCVGYNGSAPHSPAPEIMISLARVAFGVVAAIAVSLAVAQPRELQGTSDTFSTAGVVLAWGILRPNGDASQVVDIRLAVDPMTYPRLVVVASDPSKSSERVLATSLTAGLSDVRLRRSAVERYPRTEFRFFATAKPEPGERAALIVHFAGLPPGVPELPNEARLDASLGERVARAKAAAKPR